MCLSAAEAGTSPVEGVCFVYYCVFYVCTGEKKKKRQIDTERRRGGAVFNKWKFHFPGLSSLSQQLVSVSAGPFFLGFFSHQGFLQLYVDQQSELRTDYAHYKTLPFSQVGRYASYLLSLPPVYLTQFCRTRSTKLASASQQRVLFVAGVIAERRKGLTPRPRS